jgi:hypothetical protein
VFPGSIRILTRVPVILHERLGTWIRQLRPRLYDRPVRWFESRATSELDVLLTGLALPLVLIDLGRDAAAGLRDIGLVSLRVPDARILAIDSGGRPDVAAAAREMGATHVFSGFVPPPVVAELMSHWIMAARLGIERAGWSRTTFPDTETDPWSWLSDYLDGPGTASRGQPPRPDRPEKPRRPDLGPNDPEKSPANRDWPRGTPMPLLNEG